MLLGFLGLLGFLVLLGLLVLLGPLMPPMLSVLSGLLVLLGILVHSGFPKLLYIRCLLKLLKLLELLLPVPVPVSRVRCRRSPTTMKASDRLAAAMA